MTKGPYGTGPIIVGTNATDQAQIYFSAAGVTVANGLVDNSAVGVDLNGTLRVDAASEVIAGAVQLNNSGIAIDSNSAGSITISGQISSIGGSATGVTVQNAILASTAQNKATTLTLANVGPANSYTGDTVVNYTQGIITLGANDQIPNGIGKGNLSITLGTFNMAGFSDTVNGLSGAGTVDGVSGTPTLTVGDNDQTSSFTGVIKNTASTLAITKIGNGIQTLSGANTYTGNTTINAGTLKLNAASSIANSPSIILASSANFDVSTLTSALALGSGQALKSSASGAATTATLTTVSTKNLTLSAGGLAFTAYGGANGNSSWEARFPPRRSFSVV